MRVLLPPSETKREGGSARPLDIGALAFEELSPLRERIVSALVDLASRPGECMRVLKLGPKLSHEVDRNASLRTSPTMPAIDRYTGVLFDGLEADTLTGTSREDVLASTYIQSALWGPISAGDVIPTYRLSSTSRLPSLGHSTQVLWASATSNLEGLWSGFTLDMRSESYAAMTAPPAESEWFYLRVATRDSSGRVSALNHFNKKAKGELLRSLAISGGLSAIRTRNDLLDWAGGHGWTMNQSSATEVTVLV